MGPPGAGKGTQAKRLVDKFAMVHLSSGDIFRAEKASGSELGTQLAGHMDAGKLVPDETVVAMMAKAITDVRADAGLMLDGFPRTVAQAEALDAQLAEAGRPLEAVVVIAAAEEVIVERITGRRMCACGQAYHVKFLPPKTEGVCDKCGLALIQRDDDSEAVVRERLAAYTRQTEPVIAYYRGAGRVKVIEIDGGKPPDEVTDALVKAIEACGASGQ